MNAHPFVIYLFGLRLPCVGPIYPRLSEELNESPATTVRSSRHPEIAQHHTRNHLSLFPGRRRWPSRRLERARRRSALPHRPRDVRHGHPTPSTSTTPIP